MMSDKPEVVLWIFTMAHIVWAQPENRISVQIHPKPVAWGTFVRLKIQSNNSVIQQQIFFYKAWSKGSATEAPVTDVHDVHCSNSPAWGVFEPQMLVTGAVEQPVKPPACLK